MRYIIASIILFCSCAMHAQEWANFKRYEQANKELTQRPDVVFMGNSITDFWIRDHAEFFTDNKFVDRGISGQTAQQMLVRFQADVVNLHPRVVVILAGVNDIALNQGSISIEHIAECVKSMTQLARANDIIPVICSGLPAGGFYWRPDVENVPETIKAYNELLRAYASEAGIAFVDYHSALDNGQGCMDKENSADGVHPTPAGYTVMENTVLPVLHEILK